MPDILEPGGAWSPTKDQAVNTETFWEEALARYQKPPGTPPWHTIDTCRTECPVHESTHPQHNYSNQQPQHQYSHVGLSDFLGLSTPPVSSTASSQEIYEAGFHPVPFHIQDPAFFVLGNNQDNEQPNRGPSIFVFDPQGCNTLQDWSVAPVPEPAPLDQQTNSAGEWQHSFNITDTNPNFHQFQHLIEQAIPSQYSDFHLNNATGAIQKYGWSTPQDDPADQTPVNDVNAFSNTTRHSPVSLSLHNPRGEFDHLSAGDQPSPAKRVKISTPSPPKSKKNEQTKIIKRGPVAQFVFATNNHIRRMAYGPQRLGEVNERRKTGACLCCSWLKKTCKMPEGSTEVLGNAPCQACKNRMESMGTHICFIFNIKDIQMFRSHSPLHTRDATEPIDFIPDTTKWIEIRLTGALQSESIRVQCRQFKPHKDDVLVKMFGTSQHIPMSPYAVVNLDAYKKALAPMLPALTETFLEDLERTGCSSAVSKTLRAAIRYRNEHPTALVGEAQRIWVYTRLCGTEKVLVGAQQFGVAPVQEEGVELEGMVPVPPKVDHQTDTAMIESMKKDAPILVKKLKKLIDKRQREDWYEIFLTVFIVLNNLEFLLRRQELFLEEMKMHRDRLRDLAQSSGKYNTTRDMAVVQRCIEGSEYFIFEFKRSANQILQIYQLYASTKAVPFAAKRTAKELKEASLLPHEIAYVEEMQKDVDDLINQCRDEHETRSHRHEMEWVAQLFQQLDCKT